MAPTSSTARTPRVRHPTYAIPRAQPAHHFLQANRCSPSSHAGRAWKPSPTVAGKASASHPRRHQPLSRGAVRRDSSPFRGAKGVGAAQPRYSFTHAARNPSVAAQCAATAPLSGEPRVGGDGWPCASAFRDIGVRRAGAVHVQSPRMGAGFFYSVGASSGGFLPLCRARAVVSGRFSLRSSKKAMTEKVTAPRKQTNRSSIVS